MENYKKIKLDTEVSYIGINNFKFNKIFDSETLIFTYNEVEDLNQSIEFFVMTKYKDKLEKPTIEKGEIIVSNL